MNIWSLHQIRRIDLKMILVILSIMIIGLIVISIIPHSEMADPLNEPFFTPLVKSQIKWYVIGWGVYFFMAGFDYNKLREWAWILYVIMIVSLIGLFFTHPIQNVYRWYRIPGLGFDIQPSEIAKLIVVIALSWYLERKKNDSRSLKTVLGSGIIVGIPFLLILKQPDLGTALILYPMSLVMFYFADIHPIVIKLMSIMGIIALTLVLLIFLGVLPHEDLRPIATSLVKDYQYERLNPNTHHQRAASTAIALGGIFGKGWRAGAFTGGGWLPAAYTDSVFSNFGEHYGLCGLIFLLALFYSLIYFSFRASLVAKDSFGKLLAAGLAVYLAMHILINIGMMCGLLPITGVPLILVTYGGSSVITTMAALGILQSIYSQRFMF